eukprot:134066_1
MNQPTGADTYISMTVREKYHYGQVKYQEGFKAGFQMNLSINQTAIPSIPSITNLPMPQIPIAMPQIQIAMPQIPMPQIPILPQGLSTPTIPAKSGDIPPPYDDRNSILLDTTKAAKSIKQKVKANIKSKKETDSDVEVLDLTNADSKTLQRFGLGEKEVEHAMYHVFKNFTLNKKTLSKKINKKVKPKLRKIWQLLGNNGLIDKAGKANRNHYTMNMEIYYNDAGNLKPLNRLHFMYPMDNQVAKIYERVRKTIDDEIFEDQKQLLKATKGGKNDKVLSQKDMNNLDGDKSVVEDICLDSKKIDVDSDIDKNHNKKRIIEQIESEDESEKENKHEIDYDEPPKKKTKLNIVNCDEEPTNTNS